MSYVYMYSSWTKNNALELPKKFMHSSWTKNNTLELPKKFNTQRPIVDVM